MILLVFGDYSHFAFWPLIAGLLAAAKFGAQPKAGEPRDLMVRLTFGFGKLVLAWHFAVFVAGDAWWPKGLPYIHHLVNVAFCFLVFFAVYFRTHVQMRTALVPNLLTGGRGLKLQ